MANKDGYTNLSYMVIPATTIMIDSQYIASHLVPDKFTSDKHIVVMRRYATNRDLLDRHGVLSNDALLLQDMTYACEFIFRSMREAYGFIELVITFGYKQDMWDCQVICEAWIDKQYTKKGDINGKTRDDIQK